MLLDFSHHSDHRPFLSAAQMRLAAALLDTFHHMIDLLFRCIRRHVDNHNCSLNCDVVLFSALAETYEPRIRKSTASFSNSLSALATSGSCAVACRSR